MRNNRRALDFSRVLTTNTIYLENLERPFRESISRKFAFLTSTGSISFSLTPQKNVQCYASKLSPAGRYCIDVNLFDNYLNLNERRKLLTDKRLLWRGAINKKPPPGTRGPEVWSAFCV